MGYCTTDEVRAMIKDDAVNTLIGGAYIDEPEQREELLLPIITEAIADASGEIDGYLSKRYTAPLPHPPKVLNKFAKDIAVYNVFSRIGIDEQSEQKNILNRYQAAIKFLTLVAEGKVDIGVSDTSETARTGFSVSSSPRRFSRDSMKGM